MIFYIFALVFYVLSIICWAYYILWVYLAIRDLNIKLDQIEEYKRISIIKIDKS